MSEPLLIGACLLDHRQLAAARRDVHAGMFANPAHRLLWDAMCQVADDGAIPDPPTVLDHIVASGQVEQLGDVSRVHGLYQGVTAANALHYAGQVVKAHRARNLSGALRQGMLELDDGGEVDTVLAAVNAAAGRQTGAGQWRPSELTDRLQRLLADGGVGEVWSTGWPKVDEVWKPAPGTLTVVTGVPGAGKSTVLDPALLFQVAQGRRVAVWSPEQAPVESHLMQLAWSWHGRHPEQLPPQQLRDTLAEWDGPLTMLDPDDASLSSVLARASGLDATDGLDVLLIDPWNSLEHKMGQQRQDLYLQEQIGRVFRFARSSGVAVWIVAHPTKLQRMPGTETCWQPPTLYDISGGAEWANKADHVVTVWRDAAGERTPPHVVQVIVSKVRRAWWGKVGRRTLRFDMGTRTYAEQPIDQEQAA